MYRYPAEKRLIQAEIRHWYSNRESGVETGNVFYGSEGVLMIKDYNQFKIIRGHGSKQREGMWIGAPYQVALHFENFLRLLMDSGELFDEQFDEGSQQGFSSSSHVVNKLEEPQIYR